MSWYEFRQSGNPLEVVQVKKMDLELLASGDGTEIIRHVMQPGAVFGLRPQDDWYALEFVLVLEGELTWRRPDGGELQVLGPGDHVSFLPVRDETLLRAETHAVVLYVCSKPVFHFASQEIRTLMDMCVAVEQKDGYTFHHCKRIMDLSTLVGTRMKLPPGPMQALTYGSFLHDLGKVGIPETILGKPGKLTDAEYALMKTHSTIGRSMLEKTFMKEAAVIVEQHHERLDGSGYPHGLKGDEILLEAQIVAVVDSYDAMTSDRVYSKGRPKEEAVAELLRCVDRWYRRDVVENFIGVLESASI